MAVTKVTYKQVLDLWTNSAKTNFMSPHMAFVKSGWPGRPTGCLLSRLWDLFIFKLCGKASPVIILISWL